MSVAVPTEYSRLLGTLDGWLLGPDVPTEYSRGPEGERQNCEIFVLVEKVIRVETFLL